MNTYDSHRRVARGHHRVVFRGGETRDVSLDNEEIGSTTQRRQQQEQEDRRIINELPPHWDVFSER